MEAECYAGAVSLLRGDWGPRGCDDIMGDSIFGRDMGHRWWWWWWWWASTWGFPSTWERTRIEELNICEGIRGSGHVVDVLFSVAWNCRPLSHRLRGWGLSVLTLFISVLWCGSLQQLHSDSRVAINEKTVSSNRLQMLLLESFPILVIWLITYEQVTQASEILKTCVTKITTDHYKSMEEIRGDVRVTLWCTNTSSHPFVLSAVCSILFKTSYDCN